MEPAQRNLNARYVAQQHDPPSSTGPIRPLQPNQGVPTRFWLDLEPSWPLGYLASLKGTSALEKRLRLAAPARWPAGRSVPGQSYERGSTPAPSLPTEPHVKPNERHVLTMTDNLPNPNLEIHTIAGCIGRLNHRQ